MILPKQINDLLKKRTWRFLFCGLVAALVVGGIFCAGFATGKYAEQNKAPLSLSSLTLVSRSSADARLIEEAWDFIHEKYVAQDKINDEDLIYGAVRGMVEALDDPYSA